MTPDKAAIRTYFAKLGLSEEIADIYLSLYSYGPQTISQLSRSAQLERTRIYRLIDQLLASNLIEVETHYKRGILKAAPIANLNILISQKEHELKSLQDELQLVEQVLSRNSLSSPASRVQFYQGAEGAKQMLWNETKAKSEVLSILYENIQIKTNSRFFERWVKTCNEAKLRFRSIVGPSFVESEQSWYGHHQNERLRSWEGRLVSTDIFSITHTTFIYDDVVAYYNWKDNKIFGIEIYNKEIAASQRQLFELLWPKGAPISNKSTQ